MNNEAQFGVRFAVKNAKQVQKTMDAINAKLKRMGVSAEQTGKKLDQTGKDAEQTGKKQEQAFENGAKKADQMSKSLDRVVKKWLSIGGAVALVATIIRKAFNKVDEITGLRAMATSAGIAASRIESLGKKLREYGGDASSASSAYTSLGDVLGAARSGRGISQDIVTASSRYGIALNGGMLTEDQLMTNIARAMQVQRKRGNMYGVRDIASAFGIDEPMMLHLSQAGANWNRGLPAANLAAKQAEAQKLKELQLKLSNMADKLIAEVIPLLIPALQGIIDVVAWLKSKYQIKDTNKDFSVSVNGKTTTAHVMDDGTYLIKGKQYYANSIAEALTKAQTGSTVAGMNSLSDNTRLGIAREYADLYNKDLNAYGGANFALNRINDMLTGVNGTHANLVNTGGRLQIVIEDKAGVLRNTRVSASSNEYGNYSLDVATSGK